MGFETLAAQIIMIGAFLYFVSIMFTVFNDNWFDVHDSLLKRNELSSKKIDEQLKITFVNHDSIKNLTSIEIENTGSEIIDIGMLDIFVSESRIPRNNTNRTYDVKSFSEIKNPGLFDPTELAKINISQHLNSGNYYVQIFTKRGNTALKSFSVV